MTPLLLSAMLATLLASRRDRPAEGSVFQRRALDAAREGVRRVRPPAAAGLLYPAEPETLYRQIDRLMIDAQPAGLREVRAIMVPHADYAYCGEVAAASYREASRDFRRVFLLAANPSNEEDFAGVVIPEETHYAVPSAEVPLSAVLDDLAKDPLFVSRSAAHPMRMLELQLPFLWYLRGKPDPVDFTVVPMILGRMDRLEIEKLARILDGYVESQTLFIFSVDLSRYYPDEVARKLDQFSIEAMMSRNEDRLRRATTDGDQVLRTMLQLADRRGWEATFLAYRNSGEVSGDRIHVVGYASVVFAERLVLTREEQHDLLAYARRVMEVYLELGQTLEPEPELLSRRPVFRMPRAVFVTLRKEDQLRGCMGDLISSKPLYAGVQRCAIEAAVGDPRFAAVRSEELPELKISLSILDFPRKVEVERPEDYLAALRPGLDGVILIYKGRQSTFLPAVWREIPDPRDFLSRLSLKQGSPEACWLDPEAVVYRYSACEIREEPGSQPCS